MSAAHLATIMRQLTNPDESAKPKAEQQIESGMKQMNLEEKKE